MWTNEARTEIAASADAVFAVWADVEARPGWDDHDEWVRLEGPLAVGSAIRTKTRGAPAATVRISELAPGRRMVTEGVVPLGRLRFIFTIEEAGGGRVVATYRQELEGVASPLLARLFGPRMAADAPVTLERLAQRVAALREGAR